MNSQKSDSNKTCYIHAGMCKTGSSTIQESLHKSRKILLVNGINYLDTTHANHSHLLGSLFRTELDEFFAEGIDSVPKDYADPKMNRDDFFSELSVNRFQKFIMSGEALAGFTEKDLKNLKSSLDPFFDTYVIIIYVREPVSLVSSRVQQLIKRNKVLNFITPKPNYRRAIEKFYDVFGRENVVLRNFDKKHLIEGDVLSDFIHCIGEGPKLINSVDRVTKNVGLSRAAISINHEINKSKPAFINGERNNQRAKFGKLLRQHDVGEEKFSFVPSKEYFDSIMDDVDWINTQLGKEFAFEIIVPPPTENHFCDQVNVSYAAHLINEALLMAEKKQNVINKLKRKIERLEQTIL